MKNSPLRSYLKRGGGTYSYNNDTYHDNAEYAIDKLDSPLTESEQSTRKITTLHPADLYSVDLVSDIVLHLRIHHGDGITLDDVSFYCYYNNEAYEMQSQLSNWLK